MIDPAARDWTWPTGRRHLLPRAREVLAAGGVRGVAMSLLAHTIYRRLVVMALSLEAPVREARPSPGIAVHRLRHCDIDAYLGMRPDTSRDEVRRRLETGCHCFVVRHEGRIVHAGWATATTAWIDYLGCEMPLEAGDVYQFDSFTTPQFRGRRLAQARIAAMARELRQDGYRRLVAAVLPENTAAFGPLRALGYRVVGRIAVARLGPWRHVLYRVSQPRAPEAGADAHAYWDDVVREALRASPVEPWWAYMQSVYTALMRRWLPPAGVGLKTDLFEETLTSHHLLGPLGPPSVGLDCSLAVAGGARTRLVQEGHRRQVVVGDLRQVPLRSGSVARVVAGSSHDHFASAAELDAGLAELARVLAPGGVLLLTLDNPENPLVWLRNHLPFSWLHRLGLVPYFVGRTYGRRTARARLEALGLSVTTVTAVAHAPRVPAIWLARFLHRIGAPRASARLGRLLQAFERLERWPTRFHTGYYVALRACKPDETSSP